MGVEIGEVAVVGATASVYKHVEPRAVIGGNPAKLIKMRKITTNPISGGKLNPFTSASCAALEERRAA